MTLAELLAQTRVSADVLQDASRDVLSQREGGLTTDAMRERLIEAIGDESRVQEMLHWLTATPKAIREAMELYLEHTWEESAGRERVQAAIGDAAEAMTIAEPSREAIAAMYVVWRLVASGRAVSTESLRPVTALFLDQ